MDLLSFSNIRLFDPVVEKERVRAEIKCTLVNGDEKTFILKAKYPKSLGLECTEIIRMAMAMPLMNYGLFTDELTFEFPLATSDRLLLEDMLQEFSRDIFVNRLTYKRTKHIIPEYMPKEEDVTVYNSLPRAKVLFQRETKDKEISKVSGESYGVLSSGGKESLLTYGILKELEADVHPMYVVESGGHWRTAITAYRHHMTQEENTTRVWSNVDRFYNFMLDNLHFIRNDHRMIRADVYPIRLCIFPFYIFLLLPLFIRRGINNLLMGSEFDDLREKPVYKGIEHHNGVYDQTQKFDIRMEKWYSSRLPGMRQWSMLRPISGLVVERILVNRYSELARLQRSCHSCRQDRGNIIPCGECSKCLGVLLFLKANNADPLSMGFLEKDVEMASSRLENGGLKLDFEEAEHSAYLAFSSEPSKYFKGKEHSHVESMHAHPGISDPCLLPHGLRKGILHIMEEYTNGYTVLGEGGWKYVSMQRVLDKCP